ncbi:MAG TPA: ABC transporter substrate-binding protein [Gammaproteobacteria bacterium]|nr:ABC transporter substrate-binding protein [Gammaproteobacteria bacterium]
MNIQRLLQFCFRFRILVGFVALLSMLYMNISFAASQKEVRVSIIQIVEHPELDATRQGILDVLKQSEHTIHIDFQSAQGNSALATQIAQQFVGTSPNVMVGIGTTATQALISANQRYAIPIVFSSVSDPIGSKIVKDLKHPEGVVTGVSNFIDPALQFDLFKKILPKLTKLGVIYNPGEANSVALVEQMKQVATQKGLELVLATANTTANVNQAAHALISQVQAIFINNDNTALSAFDSIVNISAKNKIPVFCSGIDMINHGALATIGANQYMVGQQTGKMILEILAGKSPQDIPVAFPEKTEIQIKSDDEP